MARKSERRPAAPIHGVYFPAMRIVFISGPKFSLTFRDVRGFQYIRDRIYHFGLRTENGWNRDGSGRYVARLHRSRNL